MTDEIAGLMAAVETDIPEALKPIHVVRTDTSTNPVCTCDQYPGAIDADGKPAQHERGCAYHHPTPSQLWDAYREEPHRIAEARKLLASRDAEIERLREVLRRIEQRGDEFLRNDHDYETPLLQRSAGDRAANAMYVVARTALAEKEENAI